VLLKRPDGSKLDRTFSIQWRGLNGTNTLSGRMMLICLASGRDDTSSRRLTGNLNFFYLFRSAESSENALISGIPVYSIFYT
jgi:hypothetical protein